MNSTREVHLLLTDAIERFEAEHKASADPAKSEELAAAIADARAALALLASRQTQRDERQKRATDWADLQPKLRTAYDKVETLQAKSAKADEAYFLATKALKVVHEVTALRPFPSQEEIDAHKRLVLKAEAMNEAKAKKARDANLIRQELARDLHEARKAYQQLAWQAHRVAPREGTAA